MPLGKLSGIEATSKKWENGRINEGQNGTVMYHKLAQIGIYEQQGQFF
jgi:hypothetical protein